MREILFRGKRAKDNKWIYGFYVTDDANQAFIHAESLTPGKGLFHVKPKTVGQYTGLNDKNNVKIFEGDIVEYKTLRLLVRFAEEYGCFTVDDKFWISAHSEFRIIGNVHDTPELLERDKEAAP